MIQLAVAFACLALLTHAAAAQDVRERTIKVAHQNSREHAQGQGVAKFAEIVAQKSGGKMKVLQLAGGMQGGDLATLSAVQNGTLDMTVMNAGLLSGVAKEAGLVDRPFLFNDVKEADAVMDGPFGQKLAARIGERNLVVLGYWDLGFRDVTNSKRPIARLEDFAGLKLRVVQSPAIIDAFKALGATPTPMPFPEVYEALKRKTVDGQENPLTVIADANFQSVQPYLTITNHVYNAQALLMSRRAWDSLNAAERKVIEDAAAEATAYERKASREQAASVLEALKKSGMTVSELPLAEIARIRDKVAPVVEKYSAQAGTAMAKELDAAIAQARR